jgi:hypothetical protein
MNEALLVLSDGVWVFTWWQQPQYSQFCYYVPFVNVKWSEQVNDLCTARTVAYAC